LGVKVGNSERDYVGGYKTGTVLVAAAATTATTTKIIKLNYLFSYINSRATGTNYKVSIIGQIKRKGQQRTCVGEIAYK
jgi:hypothetical protein